MRTYIRQRQYPQHQDRFKERLGGFKAPCLRCPIWIHAVSYGEAVLAEQLVKGLKNRLLDCDIVVTTTTFTGSQRIQSTIGEQVFHVYLPYDLPLLVNRFLKKIKPSLLIVLETELWPTLLKASYTKKIPILLANARLSEKSSKRYQYIGPLVRAMLNQITAVAAQTQLDAQRFIHLGLEPKKSLVFGSIKFDLTISSSLIEQGQILRQALGKDRIVWIAASTHPGEEEMVLEAFHELRQHIPDLLLILVPRHPERFEQVAQLCKRKGYRLHKRTAAILPVSEIDIYLGDTLGELLIFYAAADMAFVGGSLVPVGGHNVLEPMALGIPTWIGRYFFNFTEIVKNLERQKALQIVNTPSELAEKMSQMQKNKEIRQAQVEYAQQALKENTGALDKHLDWIEKQWLSAKFHRGPLIEKIVS